MSSYLVVVVVVAVVVGVVVVGGGVVVVVVVGGGGGGVVVVVVALPLAAPAVVDLPRVEHYTSKLRPESRHCILPVAQGLNNTQAATCLG